MISLRFNVCAALLVALATVGLLSAEEERIWPLEGHVGSPPKRSINCETCQVLMDITAHEMMQYQKKNGLTRKGMVDIAIMEVINSQHLCTYGSFLPYSDKTENFAVYAMTSVCSSIFSENEEQFERIVPAHYGNATAMAEKFCIPKYCTELWSEDDIPDKREAKGMRNQRYAAEFSAWNAQQESIISLSSGLQYRVIAASAEGTSPKATDSVSVHYKGRTLSGIEFDSSYKRKAPVEFPLNGVIAGWTEGIQLMKEGDSFEFFIPPTLAYGTNGAGNAIGPNELLVFEVQLLKVLPSLKTEGGEL